MQIKALHALVLKEFKTELRNSFSINSIILYVVSTLFVMQLAISRINPFIWIALFWIQLLYASSNALSKSFVNDGKGSMLFYYLLTSPNNLLLSKMIYNFLLLIVISTLNFLGFVFFFGSVVQNLSFFYLLIIIGSLGLSTSFTFISAIASKTKGGGGLMTILSFPTVISQLLFLIKLSKSAVDGFTLSTSANNLWVLLSVDAIIIAVSLLLFPYLWRD